LLGRLGIGWRTTQKYSGLVFNVQIAGYIFISGSLDEVTKVVSGYIKFCETMLIL